MHCYHEVSHSGFVRVYGNYWVCHAYFFIFVKLCSFVANEIWLDLKKAGIAIAGAYGEDRGQSFKKALTIIKKGLKWSMKNNLRAIL